MFLTLREKVKRLPRWKQTLSIVSLSVLVVLLPLSLAYANTTLERIVIQIVGLLANTLIQFFGFFLLRLIGILTFVAQHDIFIHSRAVTIGWVVVRDLMNMFFIVILLVISIGTILRSQTYSYRSLLTKLIIMVILVNFSKTITGIFIDFSNVVMDAFSDAVADNAAANLITGMGIEDMVTFSNRSSGEVIDTSSVIISMILAVVMMVIANIVVAGLVIILTARIIMLWILAILSPVAFAGSLLPVSQQYASRWWSELGKYLTNGPVLLFFLWLSLTIIGDPSAPPVVLGGTSRTINAAPVTSVAVVASAISSPQRIYDYVVAIALLVATMKLSQEMGGVGASLAAKAQNWTRKAIVSAPLKTMKWAAKTADRKWGPGLQYMPEKIKHSLEERKKKQKQAAEERGMKYLRKAFHVETWGQEDVDKEAEKLQDKQGVSREAIDRVKGAKDAKAVKDIYNGLDQKDKGTAELQDLMNFHETNKKAEAKEVKQQVLRKKWGKERLVNQKIRPGISGMMRMFLSNTDDFMEDFGYLDQIFNPKSKLWALAGRGINPHHETNEFHKIRARYEEKKKTAPIHVDERTYNEEQERVQADEAGLENARQNISGKQFGNTAFMADILRQVMFDYNREMASLGAQILDAKNNGDTEEEKKLKEKRGGYKADQKALEDSIKAYTDKEDERQKHDKERKKQQSIYDDDASTPQQQNDARAAITRLDVLLKQDDKELKGFAKKGLDLRTITFKDDKKFDELLKAALEVSESDIKSDRKAFSRKQNAVTLKEAREKNEAEKEKLDAIEKERTEQQIRMEKMKAPSFFESEARKRQLEMEVTKNVNTDNWTEIASAMREALEKRDTVKFGGLFRKATSDANGNEILDYFGFSSNARGMNEFKKKILMGHLGMNENQSGSLLNDIGYLAERVNHWGMARNHRVNQFGLYEAIPDDDRFQELTAEMSKLNIADLVQKGNRLAYGGETPRYNDKTRKMERDFSFDEHGLSAVAFNFPEIINTMDRRPLNKNAATKFMSPAAERQLRRLGNLPFVPAAQYAQFFNLLRRHSGRSRGFDLGGSYGPYHNIIRQ